MTARVPTDAAQAAGPPAEPPPHGQGPWPTVLVLGSLLAILALAVGVTIWRRDSSPKRLPPVTVTSAQAVSTTTDPQAATKAQILAAYRAAWDEQLAVGRDPKATADDNRLRAHRTGNSLATIQLALVKFKAHNEVYVGDVTLHPTVVELGTDTAMIRDCLDDATGGADATTGRIVEPATRAISTITVMMKLVAGTWKQNDYRDERVPCAPPAS